MINYKKYKLLKILVVPQSRTRTLSVVSFYVTLLFLCITVAISIPIL